MSRLQVFYKYFIVASNFMGTLDDFNSELRYNGLFKRIVYSYFCGTDPAISTDKVLAGHSEMISKVIALNSCYGEHLPAIANLFYHFEDIAEELIHHLCKIKPHIEQLHQEKHEGFLPTLSKILSGIDRKWSYNWTRIPASVNLLDQTFAICYIHPSVIISGSLKNVFLCLGMTFIIQISRDYQYRIKPSPLLKS